VIPDFVAFPVNLTKKKSAAPANPRSNRLRLEKLDEELRMLKTRR